MSGFEENLALLIGTVIVLIVISLFSLIMSFVYSIQLRRTKKRFELFMQKKGADNIEDLLNGWKKEMDYIKENVLDHNQVIEKIKTELAKQKGNVGMIRYNALYEGGSDLSFSVAFLDKNRDGVVFTSIYGRDNSRVFIKPVQAGKSSYRLTPEEEEVIEQALR